MKIYFERGDEEKIIKIEKKTMLKDILEMFGITNESVILVKNGNVCLEDCSVCDDDEVQVLSVVSGG